MSAPSPHNHHPATPEPLKAAIDLLEKAASDRALLASLSEADHTRLMKAAGDLYCPDVDQRRRLVKAKVKQRKAARQSQDDSKLNATGIRALRREKVFTTPNVFPPLHFQQVEVTDNPDFHEAVEPQNCYVCKRDYSQIHHFYDQLCPACADLNWRKRGELADLRGRVALLTGGRVKIGYQAGIKLLRSGAQLIVTTRFPRDSAMRYAAEPDFKDWGHRLEVFGLDLRHTPSVEAFCRHVMAKYPRLDFIINNACQTVRRPPDFYAHMMEREHGPLHELPPEVKPLVGAYEGLRGYHLLPESGTQPPHLAGPIRPAALRTRERGARIFTGGRPDARGDAVTGAPAAGGTGGTAGLVPGGPAGPGLATGGFARAQFLAAAHGRGARGGAARGPTRQRHCPLHP